MSDPRTEFVDVQTRLATLPEDDDRVPELLGRERQLLREHDAEWSRAAAPHARAWGYRGGLLERLDLDAEVFLEHGETFLRDLPLVALTLRTQNAAVLRRVLASPALARVRELRFRKCPWASDIIQGLADNAHSPRWTHLTLDEVNGPYRPLATSANFAHLRSFRLTRGMIDDGDLAALAASKTLDQLEGLHLPVCSEVTAAGVATLGGARSLPRLRQLSLGSFQIRDEGLIHLVESPLLARLTHLNLEECSIEEEGLIRLAASPAVGELVELDLGMNVASDAGIESLGRSTRFRELTTLTLPQSEGPVSSEALAALFTSPIFANLRHLRLTRFELGLEGASHLARCELLQNLLSLGLRFVDLTPDSILAILKSRHLHRLLHLDLSYNEFISACVKALTLGKNLPRLRTIDLRGCTLGPGDLGTLVRSQRVRKGSLLPDLRENALGEEHLATLARAGVPARLVGDFAENVESIQKLESFVQAQEINPRTYLEADYAGTRKPQGVYPLVIHDPLRDDATARTVLLSPQLTRDAAAGVDETGFWNREDAPWDEDIIVD